MHIHQGPPLLAACWADAQAISCMVIARLAARLHLCECSQAVNSIMLGSHQLVANNRAAFNLSVYHRLKHMVPSEVAHLWLAEVGKSFLFAVHCSWYNS